MEYTIHYCFCSAYLCITFNPSFFSSDLQQLKCYIEVCKAIIEKSEFHHLDSLQKVGESLNSLVYCPLDTVGFNEFNKICKSVLNALQRIKNLTSSLVCICLNVCM